MKCFFFAPKKLKISSMQFERHDTEIMVILPKNYHGYLTSKFKADETEAISSDQQQIWIGILNRSLTEETTIKKSKPFGFFVLESKGEVKIKHETVKKTKTTSSKVSKKDTKRWVFKRI